MPRQRLRGRDRAASDVRPVPIHSTDAAAWCSACAHAARSVRTQPPCAPTSHLPGGPRTSRDCAGLLSRGRHGLGDAQLGGAAVVGCRPRPAASARLGGTRRGHSPGSQQPGLRVHGHKATALLPTDRTLPTDDADTPPMTPAGRLDTSTGEPCRCGRKTKSPSTHSLNPRPSNVPHQVSQTS